MWTITLLWVTIAFSVTSCIANPIKAGIEKSYSYYAENYVYSSYFDKYRSQWNIYGQLTVQTFDDYEIIQLNDVKIKVFNGHHVEADGIYKMDIPKEAHAISEPYKFYYNSSIAVNENEPLWSLNMKRSLASLLYIDETQLNVPEVVVAEKSMYGDCNVTYKTTDEQNNKLKLNKIIDIAQCGGEIQSYYGINKVTDCTGLNHEQMKRITSRTYHFNDKKDLQKVDRIEAQNKIIFQVTPNDPHTQKLKQYQSLELTYFGEIKKSIDISKATNQKEIKFEHSAKAMDGRTTEEDFTTEELVTKLINKLNGMTEQLNNKTAENTNEISDALNNIWEILTIQTFASLDETMERIKDNKAKKDIFLSVLPYIGTNFTFKYISKLITSNYVEDNQMIKLLAIFPKLTNDKTADKLTDMKILMNLPSKNTLVKNSGILSFAALVYDTYKAEEISKDILEEYIHQFVKLFKESKDYERKMVHLMSLQNMDVDLETMLPIIQDKDESPHIRALAIKIVLPKFIADGDKSLEVFMPMLKDTKLSLELRVLALTVLIECNMSVDEFDVVYQYLKEETDDVNTQHLYRYLYTSLVSYSLDSHTVCTSIIALNSDEYLPKLKAPKAVNSWLTGNYRTGLTNKGPDFGSTTQLKMVGNPDTISVDVLDFTFETLSLGLEKKMQVHLKIQGLVDKLLQVYFIDKKTPLKSINEFLSFLKENHMQLVLPELHIELIVYIDDRVVFASHLNKKSFDTKKYQEFLETLMKFFQDGFSVRFPVMDYVHIPSDLGTDLTFNLNEEMIDFQANENIKDFHFDENIDYAIKYRHYKSITKSIDFYNPISNLRQVSFNTVFLNAYTELPFKFTRDESKNIYLQIDNDKLILKDIQQISRGIFVENETILHEYCPKCPEIDVYEDKAENLKFSQIYQVPVMAHICEVNVNNTGGDGKDDSKNLMYSALQNAVGNYEVFPPVFLWYYVVYMGMHQMYIPKWSSAHSTRQLIAAFKEPTVTMIDVTNIFNIRKGIFGSNEKVDYTIFVKKVKDDSILRHLNVSLRYHESPEDSTNETVNLNIDFMNDNVYAKMCVDLDTKYPPLNADYYTLEPSDPTKSKLSLKFGIYDKPTTDCSEDYIVSAELNGLFSVMDEQKEIAAKAEVSHFKECKKESVGFKYMVPKKSCRKAAEEMARYRKYDFNLTMDFGSDIDKKLKPFGAPAKIIFPIITQITEKLNLSLEFPISNSTARLIFNNDVKSLNEEIGLYLPTQREPTIDESLLLTSKFFVDDMDENIIKFGPTSTCLASNRFISAFSGRLYENLKHDKIAGAVVLVECEKAHEVVSFTEINDKQMSLKVFMDGNEIIAKPSEKGVNVTVNGEVLNYDKQIKMPTVNVYYLADDVIYVKGSLMQVYYNTEYLRIEVYSAYNNRVCGLCGL